MRTSCARAIARESSLLLDGYAARYKIVSNGRRQISAIHVAGDFIDLHSFLLKTMDHGVLALTNCRIANVPHATLEKITEEFPISHGCCGSARSSTAPSPGMADDHGTPLRHGSHGAPDLRAVPAAEGDRSRRGDTIQLPITQAELGDTLGLSTVHVNRVLQELRKEG